VNTRLKNTPAMKKSEVSLIYRVNPHSRPARIALPHPGRWLQRKRAQMDQMISRSSEDQA